MIQWFEEGKIESVEDKAVLLLLNNNSEDKSLNLLRKEDIKDTKFTHFAYFSLPETMQKTLLIFADNNGNIHSTSNNLSKIEMIGLLTLFSTELGFTSLLQTIKSQENKNV